MTEISGIGAQGWRLTKLVNGRSVGIVAAVAAARIATRLFQKASHAPEKRVFSCHVPYGGAYRAAKAGRFLLSGCCNPVRPRHQGLQLLGGGVEPPSKGDLS